MNSGLARELRWICKHDSFTVEGCITCAAADALESGDRLRAASGLAYFALCEEAADYADPIDHVMKGREALAPFFPSGVDCLGRDARLEK